MYTIVRELNPVHYKSLMLVSKIVYSIVKDVEKSWEPEQNSKVHGVYLDMLSMPPVAASKSFRFLLDKVEDWSLVFSKDEQHKLFYLSKYFSHVYDSSSRNFFLEWKRTHGGLLTMDHGLFKKFMNNAIRLHKFENKDSYFVFDHFFQLKIDRIIHPFINQYKNLLQCEELDVIKQNMVYCTTQLRMGCLVTKNRNCSYHEYFEFCSQVMLVDDLIVIYRDVADYVDLSDINQILWNKQSVKEFIRNAFEDMSIADPYIKEEYITMYCCFWVRFIQLNGKNDPEIFHYYLSNPNELEETFHLFNKAKQSVPDPIPKFLKYMQLDQGVLDAVGRFIEETENWRYIEYIAKNKNDGIEAAANCVLRFGDHFEEKLVKWSEKEHHTWKHKVATAAFEKHMARIDNYFLKRKRSDEYKSSWREKLQKS